MNELNRYACQSDWDDDEDSECKLEVPNADLMFIYQSVDMKRLYRRYGNQLVVLDAVYRNGRYPIPVFFLAVRTNVNYQTVAVFAVQQETLLTISKALRIIKSWSPDVSPRYAMVDSSNEEIAALEQTFPGNSFIDVCDLLFIIISSVFFSTWPTQSVQKIREPNLHNTRKFATHLT